MKDLNEIWKKVPGYEDYEVSNLGRIRSLKYGKVRLMDIKPCSHDYTRVCLWKNNEETRFWLHKLVYETFKGKTNLDVDHIDENPLNNRLDNLRELTHRKNISRSKKSKSGYTGVTIYEGKRKTSYYPYLQIKGKDFSLGSYDNIDDAKEAYNRAVKLEDKFDGDVKKFRELIWM